MLARPKKGPLPACQRQRARPTPVPMPWMLDNETKGKGMNDSMLGRWVEISGRLERETSKNPDDLRELDVASFKLVPVVPPRVAAAPASARRQQRRDRPHDLRRPHLHLQPEPRRQRRQPPSLPKTASQRSGDWIGRAALAGRRPHSSFVPSPATRLTRADTHCDEGRDRSRGCPFVLLSSRPRPHHFHSSTTSGVDPA